MQPCEGHKQPLGVVPPLTQFLCSRCPSLPEILLIGFFCSVRWDGLCGVESSFAKTGSPAASPRDCWDMLRPVFQISQEVSFECAMLLVAGGFCSLFSHRFSIQLRHPWELLADYSKTSFAVTKKKNVCISLLIWQTSRQFQCILEYISNIVYFFLGNLQICSESSMYIL